MKESTLEILQSPESNSALFLKDLQKDEHGIQSGRLENGVKSYFINNGIANLIAPVQLSPSDQEFKEKYDTGVSNYQQGLDWLFASFYENEQEVRKQIATILEIDDGDLILDIGCGTGSDANYLLSNSPKCKVVLADLSLEMLKAAKNRLGKFDKRTDFIACNGSYLPFKDNTFERVLHFGGINEFGEKEKAIQEFCRVTKPGGKILFGDEGIAPWLDQTEYGEMLKTANPLYAHKAPIELIPKEARHVKTHWILGNAFYLIEFRKDEGLPALNIDLPIPGKRGGTLRSRFADRNLD